MGLIRDLPFTMRAAEDTIFATCSALMTTAASTAVVGMLSNKSTASAVISAGAAATLTGRVIDRTRWPLGTRYDGVVVTASLNSTRGSTEANRKLTVGVKLQHGDSSGGGDLADYSTGFTPDDKNYFSSVRTTDHASWDGSESTGPVYAVNSGYYDLRGAKRYLAVVGSFTKNKVTTESSGDEQARVSMEATFVAGRNLPTGTDTTSPFSSSTST